MNYNIKPSTVRKYSTSAVNKGINKLNIETKPPVLKVLSPPLWGERIKKFKSDLRELHPPFKAQKILYYIIYTDTIKLQKTNLLH